MTDATVLRFDPPSDATAGYASSARRGGRLAIGAAAFDQVASIGSTLVLARLLSPRDFGILAAATTVRSMIAMVLQLSLGQAIVKRAHVDDRVASTFWWAAAGTSLLGSLAMAAAAPLLADLFGIPTAAGYMRLLSPVIFLSAIAAIGRGLLLRRLSYTAMYGIGFAEGAVFTLGKIGLALSGMGASAVILSQLAASVLEVVLFHAALRWLPKPVLATDELRSERRFAASSLLNGGLVWTGKSADYWVVGNIGSAGRLGVYYIAYVLPNILRQRLTWATTEVLFPILSRLRDDLDRYRAAYLRILRLLAFIGLPAMVGLALLAARVIQVFFGDEWAAARGPMRMLALAAACELATQAVTTVFLADGKPGRNARIEVVRLVTLTIGLAVAVIADNIVVVATAVLVSTIAAAVAAQLAICKRLEMKLLDPIRSVFPVIVATAVMSGAVALVDTATDPPAIVEMFLLVGTGALAFIGAGLLLFRRDFKELLSEAVAFAVRGR